MKKLTTVEQLSTLIEERFDAKFPLDYFGHLTKQQRAEYTKVVKAKTAKISELLNQNPLLLLDLDRGVETQAKQYFLAKTATAVINDEAVLEIFAKSNYRTLRQIAVKFHYDLETLATDADSHVRLHVARTGLHPELFVNDTISAVRYAALIASPQKINLFKSDKNAKIRAEIASYEKTNKLRPLTALFRSF